jgi:biopolymer transport protein ExbB/TolQ
MEKIEQEYYGSVLVNLRLIKSEVARLKKGDDFRLVAEDGLRAASHHDGRLTDRIDLHEWITMSLQRAVDQVNSKLNSGLGLLATVGSTAPFVGLFGTVWGIMAAFQGIGQTGSTNLAVVAPGIADALIAAAAGLFAAIPAVYFYNHLASRVKLLASEMDDFSLEFLNISERNFT